jgi:alkanesulfonate monooxygenase SsuD/methylene tetrahydromethanopterin reductase-like flavin-dependent oxidoreductase (luciferase family)
VKNDRVGVYTLVHCVDDMDEAASYGLWESVNWWYRHLAEFTLQWEMPELPKEEQMKVFPLLEPVIEGKVPVSHYQEEDMIIIGTPDECLEKILKYESVGVDQLLCYVQFGDLPHEKVMRSLELLGTKVIPALEDRGHRVDATAAV